MTTQGVADRTHRPRPQGLAIAIVGGDGAGKSTAVAATAAWLEPAFPVHRTHLGRPRPSVLTLAVKGPMYVLRSAGLLQSTRRTLDPSTASVEDFPGPWWALWHLLTARDRLHAYRRLRRQLARGRVVVADRWPLAQLHLMDGSRVAWVLDRQPAPSRVVRWLATAERRCYEEIAPPDLLVVLRLDPETAVTRRPEDEADYVRRRNGEVYDADWSQTRAVVVDASQPAEAVLAEIRDAVGRLL